MRFFDETTVFHVTHYKAGSRWVHRILKRCVEDRLLGVQADRRELLSEPIRAGRVYSACYATREEFDAIVKPPDSRQFFILRDLRDTLISGYFSLKISHPTFKVDAVNALRARLQELDLQAGLMATLDEWIPLNAEIQRSWIESGEPIIRYEDLLEDDEPILADVLLDRCELGISRRQLRRAIEAESFERLSGGRRRGEEDPSAHYRKGIAGDWRNYFDDRLTETFKERYGDLLIATGHERNHDWAPGTVAAEAPSRVGS
jgi:lipopolysaccharide transport system ATP-binding protein